MNTDYKIADLEKLLKGQSALDRKSRRIFHGRGHTFPGLEDLCIDFYPPYIHIILFKERDKKECEQLKDILYSLFKREDLCIFLQKKYQKNDQWEVLAGSPKSSDHLARAGDCSYQVKFLKNQNIGLFLDMSVGRELLKKLSEGRKVLNLFSYTCSLSVCALKYGAQHVVNVDMARSVLETGRRNHLINDIDSKKVSFQKKDIMKSLGSFKKNGPFDLVIIDPPSFQKGSFALKKDYSKIIKRLDEFTAAEGLIMACVNSPDVQSGDLQRLFSEFAPRFKFLEVYYRNATEFPEANLEKGLKILTFKKSE